MDGCAAGQSTRPRDAGTARASAATHESGAGAALGNGAFAVPAGQADALAHAPEHAADARPALAPHVPAGQREQAAAPAIEYVPGPQGPQAPLAVGALPAAQAGASAAVLPAIHPAQAPEQAAEAKPAELPNVPAGQREHTEAPASE